MTMYKEHTRISLVEGGNVFKQGDHVTLGFAPHDYAGNVMDLTGKDIAGVIYSHRKGIMYEAPATFDSAEQKISFTIDGPVDYGQFQIEFTVTDASDPDYRLKLPSAEQDGRLTIKPSVDNMDFVGVQMTTVTQLQNELQVMQTEFEGEVLPRVQSVEGRQTEVEGKQVELEATVQTGIAAFTEDTEVALARGGEVNLGARLDKTTALLADTAKNSADYVKLLQSHNLTKKPLKYQIKGDRKIDVYTPLPGSDSVLWRSQKDLNDDWIKTDNVDVYGMTGGGEPSRYWMDYGTVAGGTLNSATPPNHFATTVGTTLTQEIDGTEFYINAYTDNRGGVWEVKVDGVVNRTFSTHVSNVLPDDYLASNKTQAKVTGLTAGVHTVVLTFLGDDPSYPPSTGAGTARGWISNSAGYAIPTDKEDQFYTFVVTGVPPLSFSKKLGVMVQLSNKEPVFRAKKVGTVDALHFFPEHNSTGTAFAKEQKVLVDGVEITNWSVTASDTYIDAETVQIVQAMDLVHPEQIEPIGTMYGITTFNSLGMTFSHEVEWLTDVLISAGYAPMIPVDINFVDSLKTSFGNIYALEKTDGSRTYLTENDRSESYLFYNRNKQTEEKDYALAYGVNDIYSTFRQGETGKHFPTTGQSMLWIEHRSGGFMNKVYPQVFDNYTALAGEKFTFGATYYVGQLFNARKLA